MINYRAVGMSPLDLVELTALMKRSQGRPEISIALIDGPVVLNHQELAGTAIREIAGELKASCARPATMACTHGTFVAGILAARRGSAAPAICPQCTLLVRPVFADAGKSDGEMPSASPEEVASAIVESVDAGARVINLSAALVQPGGQHEAELEEALNYAGHRGVVVVAAAGNQGLMGSTVITRHWWVIPVAACDQQGRPLNQTNLGAAIGRRGLSAPGEKITSLGTNGATRTSSGTSAAAPFVTGAIGLLWSEFPGVSAARIKMVITQATAARRRSVAPPLLNAWAAYQTLRAAA
jgi:subtilisin family serine protease